MRKLLLAALAAVLLGSCTWHQHRGNAGHTGYQPRETRISTATAGSIEELWTAVLPPLASPPVVAGGRVFVGGGGEGNERGSIMAFDAAGEEGCSGTPRVCLPLWRETTSYPISSSPAVVGGVAYFVDDSGFLAAYDAADGALIWSGISDGGTGRGAPTVSNGVVYVGTGEGRRVMAYDVHWEDCEVRPSGFRRCPPLWTAQPEGDVYGAVSVAGGSAYVLVEPGVLHAYDAAGQRNCSGTPRVCEPLWTAAAGDHTAGSAAPVASGGLVYVVDAAQRLQVFDGAGVDGCSGTPRTCTPLWTADLPPTTSTFPLDAPAVAHGRVYAGSAVYDANGTIGCTGQPTVCSPLWQIDGGGPFPSVANDIVISGGGWVSPEGPAFPLRAFDAHGAGCAGTVCEPLWTFEPQGRLWDPPAVQNGVVYVVVTANQFDYAHLHAFGPP